jgi:hypothetical protein
MEVCENCGKSMEQAETPYLYKERIVCRPCHTTLSSFSNPIVPTPKPIVVAEKPKVKIIGPKDVYIRPKCQLCGCLMERVTHGKGSIGLFVLGFIVTAIPFVGLIVGPVLMIVAVVRACSHKTVLKCTGCGALVPCA